MKWLISFFAGLGILIGIVVKRSSANSLVGKIPVNRPALNAWKPIIDALTPQALDPAFVMKWIEVESGGNPCAVGSFKQRGPDGHPREMGIAQFYNPDDLIRINLTSDQLRAYCVPESQKLARALTGEEMRRHAQAAIDLILSCRSRALHDLHIVGAAWDLDGRDFYALIKLHHGLPGLPKRGIPAVTKLLGRPPKDFREFSEALGRVTLDTGTEKYRKAFPSILANAVKTATVVKRMNP